MLGEEECNNSFPIFSPTSFQYLISSIQREDLGEVKKGEKLLFGRFFAQIKVMQDMYVHSNYLL